jgi:glycosyltransferase involved in cell wall biosynthesis
MAMGKPVVATSMAVEGLDVVADRDVVIADTPSEQSGAISHLFSDRHAAAGLGRRARELVEEKYRWENLVPLMESVYEP